MQVRLMLFASTGSAGPLEGVNVMSMRLICTMQPANGLIYSKFEILTERKSIVMHRFPSGVGRQSIAIYQIPNLL